MFIKFTKIEFINYKTIKRGSLILDEKGVVLIQGINNDKGGSNGAGKSTIANGLLWCLFDRTLVGKETEKEILPKFIPKKEFKTEGCSVTVFILRDGVEYCITRNRKHPELKNTVIIKKRVGDHVEDLSKCVDKETNEIIVDIIGADFHSFVHSNVFSFDNIEPFLKRNDKDKKELVLPKYFIDMFKAAHKKCGEDIKIVDDKLSYFGNEILGNTVILSEKNLSLSEIKGDIVKRNEILESVRLKLKLEEQRKIEFKQTLFNYDKRGVVCTDRIKKLEEESNSYDKSRLDWTATLGILLSLNTETITIERNIGAKKLELEEYKRSDKSILTQKMAELSETSEAKGIAYTEVDKKIKAAHKDLGVIKGTLEKILVAKGELKTEFNRLTDRKLKIDDAVDIIKAESKLLTNQQSDFTEKYYSVKCKTCPWNKMSEFFDNTEEKLSILDKSFNDMSQESYRMIEVVQDAAANLEEVQLLEVECRESIDKIEKGELAELGKEEFSTQKDLHELKSTLFEMQCKVDNAKGILQEIASIELIIRDYSEKLGKIRLKIAKINEDSPEDNVRHFYELKGKIDTEIYNEGVKKTDLLKVINDTRVELNSATVIAENLKESLTVTDDLEKRQSKMSDEILTLIRTKENNLITQKELNDRLELLKFWKTGFSPAGIEGFMMDSIVNTMNTLIAKYLGYLSGNTIALTIIPDSKLKSGDIRNKISEKVENDSGGETYRTNSEGEKRIMDISVMFALKYIYEQITGTKYNILFCDEAFDKLDAQTCNLVINLINTLSDDITSLFVVSHIDTIALEFDNFVTIVKTKGISEIISESAE